MKSRIAILTGFAFLATLGGVNALAQNSARFSIPFDFTANHQVVPAGEYSVGLITDQLSAGQFLSLVNAQTGKKTLVMVRHDTAAKIRTHGYLEFYADETGRYLQEVRMPGSDLIGELSVARIPNEVAHQAPAASTIEIASR